jgi:type IV pilus assembly protein PilA
LDFTLIALFPLDVTMCLGFTGPDRTILLRCQKGFSIIELLVIVSIVGILVSIAVPLYLHYTKISKMREAMGIIKAIITSQKVEKMRTNKYYTAIGDTAPTIFVKKGIDVTDSIYFTYETVGNTDEFTVTATAVANSGITGSISYDSATNTWSSTGDITLRIRWIEQN